MLWHRCHCNGTGSETGFSFETVSGDRSSRSSLSSVTSIHYSIGKKLQLCKVLKVMTHMLVTMCLKALNKMRSVRCPAAAAKWVQKGTIDY
jgi:hypothetical protein